MRSILLPAFMTMLLRAQASKAFLSVRGGARAASGLGATTTAAIPAYDELLEKLQQISNLKHSQAVLNYDQLVFMPQAASAARGAQLSALAGVIHEKSTSPNLKVLLERAQKEVSDNGDPHLIVKLAKEDFVKNERIPEALEAKRAELSSSAYAAWVEARKNNDFASFAPVLTDCFDTCKQVAEQVRGDDEQKSLYTIMLEEYERGMPVERIDSIFDEIETALVPLLSRVLKSETKPSTACLEGTFDVDAQQEFSRKIVQTLGFDGSKGRIDVSVHPFTSSMSPSDVRITSRFSSDEWYQGLAGSVHEAGHAMYEQSLGDSNTQLDTFLSMGCHESQSLFWERHVSLTLPFWKWATPQLSKAFAMDDTLTPEEVYGAVNAVQPGLIRVAADELTYPLHVILRYKMERDVVSGSLSVSDIPSRWKEQMKDLLNVYVPSDAEGCLQDVHWASLAIGYFPTYLLGSATAAQLVHYCKKDIPDFDSKVEQGEFTEIKAWLTNKVHKHGRRYDGLDALLEEQVGEKLNPKYFIDYLTKKYTDLYQC